MMTEPTIPNHINHPKVPPSALHKEWPPYVFGSGVQAARKKPPSPFLRHAAAALRKNFPYTNRWSIRPRGLASPASPWYAALWIFLSRKHGCDLAWLPTRQETTLLMFPALEVKHLRKQFSDGSLALEHIDWSVLQGETMAVIGESGSGKTTLLRLLNRLAEPTSGEILIQGEPVHGQNPILLRRRLGYVPQDGGLFPHWTIQRNVCLIPHLLGWSRHQQDTRFLEVMQMVNLDAKQLAARYPIELSGGQRQRVAVARALAADPSIILLDEPFGALDPLTRQELQHQFLILKQQLNKTMVLITHDLPEAFKLGDRVTVLKEGRIHQVGTPQELQRAPSTPYVKSLIDSHPSLQ